MNGVGASDSIAAPEAQLPVNRWIIGEVVETLGRLNRAFDELRFDDMADAIYHFTWGTFCDWYVELIKGAFDEETKSVAAWAFDQILVMLHPLMPFITEELWNAMGTRPYELIVAKWPEPEASVDKAAKDDIEWLIELVTNMRSTTTELGVPPGSWLIPDLINPSDQAYRLLGQYGEQLKRMIKLANYDELKEISAVPTGSAQVVVRGTTFVLDLKDYIDLDAERARLEKALAAAHKERDSLEARLSNPNFTDRAKPEAVEKARADHAEKSAEADRYRAALERLG